MFGEQTLAQFGSKSVNVVLNDNPLEKVSRLSKVHPFSYNDKVVISVQDQMGKCLCVTEEADTVMQSRMKSHSSSV